jgi:hypothetical protein
VFDAALAELQGCGGDEDQGEADDFEPGCATCGAAVGIFIGHSDAWLHYTGEGTEASPVELFDAGHEPVIAWRSAGAQTAVASAPCRDYDPNFNLHGCEMDPGHDEPHHDLNGHEWEEHLPEELVLRLLRALCRHRTRVP